MSKRMTKELVVNALENSYNCEVKAYGAFLYSDRGRQYCSYLWLLGEMKEYGYTCSISRKRNYCDNATIESFWGKMKPGSG